MFFWQFTLRTGSTAKVSYQRKHCLTTAVKALSSLPPSLFLLLSFFLPHFYIFLFWCLVALCSAFDTKQRGCPQAAQCRQTVSGELCSGERWYCGFLLFHRFVCLSAPQWCIFHLSRETVEIRTAKNNTGEILWFHSYTVSFKAGNIASKCGVMCLHESIGNMHVLQHFPLIHGCEKMFRQPLHRLCTQCILLMMYAHPHTPIYVCLYKCAVLSIQFKWENTYKSLHGVLLLAIKQVLCF